MAVLFISHSSKDDAAATSLEGWLRARGFTDIFVDHSSIAGGEKWGEALRDSAGSCRVVICLVTERWLASDECFGEFKAACYMGKRIIPLTALVLSNGPSARLASVLNEYQGFDVAACMTAAGNLDLTRDPQIERLLELGLRSAGALARVGLDPEAFAIERKLRPTPFPGLASFGDDDADAALFYGRNREIADTLEDLRKMRAERDRRVYVILGASGAGKSSLLKAGIIPRLRREAPAWLPLRAFRPGADPLLNFAEALARTYADYGKNESHGVIRDRLIDAWSKAERSGDTELSGAGLATLQAALEAETCALRAAANRAAASILISIDQAEEIARAETASADALADYLQVALAATASSWQLAFTVRTDSFAELQTHRRFQNLQARGYDLRAVPTFHFTSVVEDPARRYGVEVDHALIDALMKDAPDEDALPLLAFALERLWPYAAHRLTKESYNRMGGLTGLIEDAAERALRGIGPDQDVPLPSGAVPKRLDELGAATFVPALAQISDSGAPIRRVAGWTSFSEEQRDLLAVFDRWRLVVRKGAETGGGTVEAAHEALFREWARLKGWLEPERARLQTLRLLQIDASNWDRNSREGAFLNHRDKRLGEANALAASERYRDRLGKAELDYLVACREAERAVQRRRRRVQSLVGGLIVIIVAGLLAWWQDQWIKERYFWFANVRGHVQAAAMVRALKPGESFWDCTKSEQDYSKYCPQMVVIPAGKFMMGSPASEKDRGDDEGPRHEVTIANPFAVSRFELTVDQWDACVADGGCTLPVENVWGRGKQPAINVSWHDAQQYVRWLAKLTDQNYRLLSESEWEYATRAGSTTRWSSGDDEAALEDYAWYGKNSGHQAHPVGEKRPNAFGLHDMHGNVWEWVEDCYHDSYNGAPTDGSAWTAGDCSRRVARGGSWGSSRSAKDIRSAIRTGSSPIERAYTFGFRIGRTLGP